MDKNTFNSNEFKILAQLIDGGIRSAGINIATGGTELISAIQKFYQTNPDAETKEEPEENA